MHKEINDNLRSIDSILSLRGPIKTVINSLRLAYHKLFWIELEYLLQYCNCLI